jgi:hypothetical protein
MLQLATLQVSVERAEGERRVEARDEPGARHAQVERDTIDLTRRRCVTPAHAPP